MAAGGPAGKTRATVPGIGIARPAASVTSAARARGVATSVAAPAGKLRRVNIMGLDLPVGFVRNRGGAYVRVASAPDPQRGSYTVRCPIRNRVARAHGGAGCSRATRALNSWRLPMQNLVDGKIYGTVRADLQKQMSGLEFVRGLADGTLPLNTMARTLGYDVVAAEKGRRSEERRV